MLRTVLDTGGSCLATEANQNTELGLPLTMLRRTSEHRSMVLEMGMSGRGQIRELCNIAKPTAGVITNIGHSHIELLGSQREIALAKAELLQSITLEGVAALRFEDPWLKEMSTLCGGKVFWYGLENHLDAFPSNIRSTDSGTDFDAHVLGNSSRVHLPTFGTHNILNALSAFLIGVLNGLLLVEMADRIATLATSNGRLHMINGRDNRRMIDDCFNASPVSVKASLDVLNDLAAQSISVAILGDIYELGDFSEEGHRQIGRYVAENGINHLITIGQMAEWIADEAARTGCDRVTHFTDVGTALDTISEIVEPQSTVLVKASRDMELERVVEILL